MKLNVQDNGKRDDLIFNATFDPVEPLIGIKVGMDWFVFRELLNIHFN
jgi:hypothetical protein